MNKSELSRLFDWLVIGDFFEIARVRDAEKLSKWRLGWSIWNSAREKDTIRINQKTSHLKLFFLFFFVRDEAFSRFCWLKRIIFSQRERWKKQTFFCKICQIAFDGRVCFFWFLWEFRRVRGVKEIINNVDCSIIGRSVANIIVPENFMPKATKNN